MSTCSVKATRATAGVTQGKNEPLDLRSERTAAQETHCSSAGCSSMWEIHVGSCLSLEMHEQSGLLEMHGQFDLEMHGQLGLEMHEQPGLRFVELGFDCCFVPCG